MRAGQPMFLVHASDMAKEFVYSCLIRKSHQRPSAWQLLRFPWIKVNQMCGRSAYFLKSVASKHFFLRVRKRQTKVLLMPSAQSVPTLPAPCHILPDMPMCRLYPAPHPLRSQEVAQAACALDVLAGGVKVQPPSSAPPQSMLKPLPVTASLQARYTPAV
jgi:hypothetical protein